eukprot:Lithocolla_globosa_v1_NODE_1685_length_2400_cov_184.983369.p3 type:complete len:101 gc:universal NODE_1685_length_2400_cov_184.983369:713-1015(+)
MDSAPFAASMRSRRFLSSSAYFSESCIILSISSLLRPPDACTVIAACLSVTLSCALTLTIPLASMSKVTSIWGMPRAAGMKPENTNCPSRLLSLAIARSP